jgi:tRNA threonylcarbamoyl adenosine modification protein (Sua5/YciO/YrdC/YwlC family)
LPAAKLVPKTLWSKRKTVGIRVPNHAITLKLVQELGNPIISTSATNGSGGIVMNPIEIRSVFNNQVDLMLSAGNLSGQPSSVIDLSDTTPEILREGAGDVSLFV